MPGVDNDYRVLGVAEGAGVEQIKQAYRRLAKKHHPDVSSDPHAAERFVRIEVAYRRLVAVTRRRRRMEKRRRSSPKRDTAGAPAARREGQASSKDAVTPAEAARAAMAGREGLGSSPLGRWVPPPARRTSWHPSIVAALTRALLCALFLPVPLLALGMIFWGISAAGTPGYGEYGHPPHKGYVAAVGGGLLLAASTVVLARIWTYRPTSVKRH